MLSIRFLVVLLCAFCFNAGSVNDPAFAQAPAKPPFPGGPPSNAFPAALDSSIAKILRDWKVPGMAISIVKDGKVVVAKGYGVLELGKPDRVDENTVFDTASLSKSFTAAATATVVEEGKLSWDDPVRMHMPRVPFGDPYLAQAVTIRDLLSHRVGLESANTLTRFTGYDRDEVFSRIQYLKVKTPFRTQLDYNNTLYALGGEAAAAAAQVSWDELIRSRLLVPLGMTSSTAGELPGQNPNTAKPHHIIDDIHVPIRVVKLLNINPAAGVNSTAADMTRWLLFQLGDGTFEGRRILSPESMEEMHTRTRSSARPPPCGKRVMLSSSAATVSGGK